MEADERSSEQNGTIVQSVTSIKPSPFFYTPPAATADTLAILHLKRDSSIPVRLRTTADDGYAEGAVTNTRFGSFPHSTLIGLEWGSQVRASKVDTGTRGRKGKKGKKSGADGDGDDVRKAEDGPVAAAVLGKGNGKRKSDSAELVEEDLGAKRPKIGDSNTKADETRTRNGQKSKDSIENEAKKPGREQQSQVRINGKMDTPATNKAPVEAGSGFIHLLPPTPESWTSSLDHRTQVVYTPDYSYVLQRLRVRPGSAIIEAGAGSGSFTHAAARAIFSGRLLDCDDRGGACSSPSGKSVGQVYSYEFHAPRVETLREEINEHGLDAVVHLTHRDVCTHGFSLPSIPSPNVQAIFLDLPAPWLALKHLTRSTPDAPLDPQAAVHLCTFSPCIEQVTATVSFLRKNGWTEIEMVEVQHRRIDVRREQIGLNNEGLRGVNASAATVDEAIARLREVEHKLTDFHANKESGKKGGGANGQSNGVAKKVMSKQERLEKIKRDVEERKLYKEGNLVHRTEPEVKTHTSYLVFAVLPREWSEEDERAANDAWPVGELMRVEGKDVPEQTG